MSRPCECGYCPACLERDEEYTQAMMDRCPASDPAVEAEFAPTRVLDGDLLLYGNRAAVDHHGYLWMEETYGLGLEVEGR